MPVNMREILEKVERGELTAQQGAALLAGEELPARETQTGAAAPEPGVEQSSAWSAPAGTSGAASRRASRAAAKRSGATSRARIPGPSRRGRRHAVRRAPGAASLGPGPLSFGTR